MGEGIRLVANSPPWHDGLTGRAQMVDHFDVTPRITYENGKAVKVISYAVHDGVGLTASEYGLNDDGEFTERRFINLEHGGGSSAHIVPESRLAKIPLLKVLGKTREEVERVLENRYNAYHFERAAVGA